MTDSVSGVSGVQEAGRNSPQGGGVFKQGKERGCRKEQEDDHVDISQEATEKALEEERKSGA